MAGVGEDCQINLTASGFERQTLWSRGAHRTIQSLRRNHEEFGVGQLLMV